MIDETVYKRDKQSKDIIKEIEEKGSKVRFNNRDITIKTIITIGRDPACDVVIENDPLVSRRHAIIEKDKQNNLFITDKGSTNGTYINKNPIPANKKVPIKKGDIVQIGKTELKIVP